MANWLIPQEWILCEKKQQQQQYFGGRYVYFVNFSLAKRIEHYELITYMLRLFLLKMEYGFQNFMV